MQISDQNKRYLVALGSLIVVAFFIYKMSSNKFSCDEWANDFRDNANFHLILTKKETNNYSRGAYFYGIDLKNKQPTMYYDRSAWMAHNLDKFKIGDTLLKDVGRYGITIKRKGKIILIPFECGKVYVDIPVH
jgi:hypothetical protein